MSPFPFPSIGRVIKVGDCYPLEELAEKKVEDMLLEL